MKSFVVFGTGEPSRRLSKTVGIETAEIVERQLWYCAIDLIFAGFLVNAVRAKAYADGDWIFHRTGGVAPLL